MSHDNATDAVMELAKLIAPLDDIKRTTKLPSGNHESDSHHSLSLAITCHVIVARYCPELDSNKVMRFALVHDLLELITGDEPTLLHDEKAHAAKKKKEHEAVAIFEQQFGAYPEVLDDNLAYERLDCPEAALVYVLDKACTVWTHFFDSGENLKRLGVTNRAGIDKWYEELMKKIKGNVKAEPPQIAWQILDESFARMRHELLGD